MALTGSRRSVTDNGIVRKEVQVVVRKLAGMGGRDYQNVEREGAK
jgi:hypothetical protein